MRGRRRVLLGCLAVFAGAAVCGGVLAPGGVAARDPGASVVVRSEPWSVAGVRFAVRSGGSRLRPFHLRRSSRSIPIEIHTGDCLHGNFERPIHVDANSSAVTVTTPIAHPLRRGSQPLCLSFGAKTIHLKRPLGDRALLIGGLSHGPVPAPIKDPGDL